MSERTKKSDLIKEIASRIDGVSQKEVKVVLQATQQVIEETIVNHGRVKLFDFMYISGYEKKAQMKTNPKHGGMIEVPEHTAPKAHFTATFRNKLRGI